MTEDLEAVSALGDVVEGFAESEPFSRKKGRLRGFLAPWHCQAWRRTSPSPSVSSEMKIQPALGQAKENDSVLGSGVTSINNRTRLLSLLPSVDGAISGCGCGGERARVSNTVDARQSKSVFLIKRLAL